MSSRAPDSLAGRRCWRTPSPKTGRGCSAPAGGWPWSHLTRRTASPWEQIEDAAWDNDASLLRITTIGEYGEPRPSYTFEMQDPALLLQLLRERVTASIVLQRRVPVRGQLGLTVIGRRSPVGGVVEWMHAYDPGLDPVDPEVAAIADEALAQARAEVGDDTN